VQAPDLGNMLDQGLACAGARRNQGMALTRLQSGKLFAKTVQRHDFGSFRGFLGDLKLAFVDMA